VTELDLAQRIAVLARALSRHGYNDVTGRLTVRADDSTYMTTPSDARWDEMSASMVAHVDGDGRPLRPARNLSPGLRVQLRIHEIRGVSVVIHDHPFWSTCWAALGTVPPAFDHVAARVPPIAVVEDRIEVGPVDRRLSDVPTEASVMLLRNHGVLVTANEMTAAFFSAVSLERRSQMAWHLRGSANTISPQSEILIRSSFSAYSDDAQLFDSVVRAEVTADPTVLR